MDGGLVVLVTCGEESLGARGRGVARVDGPGSPPAPDHGLHAEVECVVVGLESLGGRGRGVARVDGPGSPPAPPPVAAAAAVVLLPVLTTIRPSWRDVYAPGGLRGHRHVQAHG